jgi:hypothetical protein
VYQFERAYLDQAEPWGSSKDVRILKPAYGRQTKFILEQLRARMKAGKDSKHPLPNTRCRHRLAALPFAGKKISMEAMTLFYSIRSFGFVSRSLLEKFLATINHAGEASISRICIQHSTYDDPIQLDNIAWKKLRDGKWGYPCKGFSEELTGLDDLRSHIRMNDHPIQLNLSA